MWPWLPSGQNIGSWLACHEFEPSTIKDPPCRGAIHVKSVESSNVFPLVWCGSKEREVPAQVSSSSSSFKMTRFVLKSPRNSFSWRAEIMMEIILLMNDPRRAGSRGQKMDEVEKRVHIHTTAINAFSLPLATGLEEPAPMGKVSLKRTVPKGLCHPSQTTSQRSRGGIGFVT
ncbi:hypothetical protein TNCV_1888811 [Trichonephila clavipes]|nr:hypothetical protein TNCV_1888811 [Trichonephila clavipes]